MYVLVIEDGDHCNMSLLAHFWEARIFDPAILEGSGGWKHQVSFEKICGKGFADVKLSRKS